MASRKQVVARDYCDTDPGGKGEVRDIVEMVLTETWAAGCRRSGKKRRIQRDNPGFALSKPMGGGAVSWAEEDCE